MPTPTKPRKRRRGFACMTPERQRQIASMGGKAAHDQGAAYQFTSEQASAAARVAHERGTAHRYTSEEARAAGRKGGLARAANKRARMEGGAT